MYFKHYSLVPAASWRWKHFSPRELASRGDGSLLVHAPSLDKLEQLRELLGAPLIINSAYRDPIYNAKIGGAPASWHKQGRAFDVSLRGHDRNRLRQLAIDVGFTGLGHYQTFLHIDTGRKRSWGKWA